MGRSRSVVEASIKVQAWRWTPGAHVAPKWAEPFGRTLAGLNRASGKYEAEDVLNAARSDRSSIHGMFLWNDREAGGLYRLDQARYFIRSLVIDVVVQDHGNPGTQTMPVAVSLGPNTGYVSTLVALGDPEMRALMVSRALAELQALKAKYGHLQELASVWEQIGAVAKKKK